MGVLSSGSAFSAQNRELETPFLRSLPRRGHRSARDRQCPVSGAALWNFSQAEQEGICQNWMNSCIKRSRNGVRMLCMSIRSKGSRLRVSEQPDKPAARVVMSLHNHHPFCPQVYLMHQRRTPCTTTTAACDAWTAKLESTHTKGSDALAACLRMPRAFHRHRCRRSSATTTTAHQPPKRRNCSQMGTRGGNPCQTNLQRRACPPGRSPIGVRRRAMVRVNRMRSRHGRVRLCRPTR